MNNRFVMIPKKIFTLNSSNKKINYKIILVVYFLVSNKDNLGNNNFTIEQLIKYWGYKSDKDTNKRFKDALNWLVENKILQDKIDFTKIKINQFIHCKSIKFELNQDNQPINYVMITDNELNVIVNIKDDNKLIDNAKLFYYFAYLKGCMYNRKINPNTGEKFHLGVEGAEVCYPSYKEINSVTKISEITIKKYNDLLEKYNLIRIGNAGRYYNKNDDTKTTYDSNNTYCLYKDEWEKELEYAINKYKERYKHIRVFGDFSNNRRSTGGQKGRLRQLKEQGKATQEQLNTLKLLEQDTSWFEIKALLDKKKNKDKLLSAV